MSVATTVNPLDGIHKDTLAAKIQARVDEYVGKARKAGNILYKFNQYEVDTISYAIAKVCYDNAEKLAAMGVEETEMGNYEDKVLKVKGKSENIWNDLKDKRTVGIIHRDYEKNLITIADPVGVVAGVAPVTNPDVTAMSYALFCMKTRNPLIISPHPRAMKVSKETVRLMIEEAKKFGLPDNAIQIIEQDDLTDEEFRMLAKQMMSSVDMVLATGGPAIVEVAYRSGTPSYGVGAGNVPVVIHDSADITKACSRIIIGRTFDNGIICASEQHIIMTEKIEKEVCAEFTKLGGYMLNAEEQKKIQSVIFTPDNRLQITAIGKNAMILAERAGIQVPEGTKVLFARGDRNAVGKDPFSSEKMFPVLTLYTINDHKDAVLLARELLDHQGAGHTAAIHINRSFEQDLQSFALTMPATHIIVNQSAATSAGGSKLNWVTPSTTLGCGTYGSTTPMKTINLTTDQLVNYKLIVKPLSKSRVPTGVLNTPPVKPMFNSDEEE